MPDGLQTFCLDLILAARRWRRLADAVVRPHGLSESTALPLVVLARRGGLRQAALAEAIGVEGPSLVRTLDQLCALGLVSRQIDPADRRAKSLNLTARGRRLTVRLSADLDDLRARVFAGVEAGDIMAADRVFTRLAAPANAPALADDTGADAP